MLSFLHPYRHNIISTLFQSMVHGAHYRSSYSQRRVNPKSNFMGPIIIVLSHRFICEDAGDPLFVYLSGHCSVGVEFPGSHGGFYGHLDRYCSSPIFVNILQWVLKSSATVLWPTLWCLYSLQNHLCQNYFSSNCILLQWQPCSYHTKHHHEYIQNDKFAY